MRIGGVGQLQLSGKLAMPQGASLKWMGAPGPLHKDGRWVRWLGTNRAIETEVRYDRCGLPEGGSGGGADKMNESIPSIVASAEGGWDGRDGSALAPRAQACHVSSACMHGRRWRSEWLL
jgi:hypothetical protein